MRRNVIPYLKPIFNTSKIDANCDKTHFYEWSAVVANEAVMHETSTSYSHLQQFAITLPSRNLYFLFSLTEICYHALGTTALLQH